MPIDRDATLKSAEKLLRQGKLDRAIEEYVRLVEDHPRDWNSINVLGDLYVRAGDVDRAVARFTAVADHLYDEGFFPKASALYKKALKAKSDHAHSLLRVVAIAERQGLTADVKAYRRELTKLGHNPVGNAPKPVQAAPVKGVGSHFPVIVQENDSRPDFSDDVDLSAALATLRAHALALPPMPEMDDATHETADIEAVFDQIRSRVGREQQTQAAELYERGLRHLREGRLVDALGDLPLAARTPTLRFRAAASLGRLLASRGEYKDAVEWLQRAAEAPPPSREEGRALLVELEDALERLKGVEQGSSRA